MAEAQFSTNFKVAKNRFNPCADRLGIPPQDSRAKDGERTAQTRSAVRAQRARESTLRTPGLTAHGLNEADRLGLLPLDSRAKDGERTAQTRSAVRAQRARERTLRMPGLTAHGLNDADRLGMPPLDSRAKDERERYKLVQPCARGAPESERCACLASRHTG